MLNFNDKVLYIGKRNRNIGKQGTIKEVDIMYKIYNITFEDGSKDLCLERELKKICCQQEFDF